MVKPGEILTYTGRYVNPLRLSPGDVDINDIAHALSMQCRYSGHTREFYSVAQHSVLCVEYLNNRGADLMILKQALLHDAAEAYIQDMARPLKEDPEFGYQYRETEAWIEQAIAAAFDVEWPWEPAVKEADLALLALERQELMPQNGVWGLLDGISVPSDFPIVSWPPEVAKRAFLDRFRDLFITNHEEDAVSEPTFEHDSPFGEFEPAVPQVISLDDFLAGRLDRAVPVDTPEGQALMQPEVHDVVRTEHGEIREPTAEEQAWFDQYRASALEELERGLGAPQDVDEWIESIHVTDENGPLAGRHPNSERYHELLGVAAETHDRKQLDYGKGDDPFANVRSSEEWGVDGWVGAMIRLNDKVKRLQSLRQKGYLANESAKDSFMDIAVYALIAYVLYEQAEAQ
jgi:hypothetical protein